MDDSNFQDEPLKLCDGQEMLVDDLLVESRWRLRRELYRPERHARNSFVTTPMTTDVPQKYVMYAESDNGTSWERPRLLTRELILEGNRLWLNACYRHLREQEQDLRVDVVRHPGFREHSKGNRGGLRRIFAGGVIEDVGRCV